MFCVVLPCRRGPRRLLAGSAVSRSVHTSTVKIWRLFGGCTAFSWGVRRAGCGFLPVFSTAGERPSGCLADYGVRAGNSRTPQRSAAFAASGQWTAVDTRTAIPPHPDGLAIRSSQTCILITLQPPPWGVHGPYMHSKVASLTYPYERNDNWHSSGAHWQRVVRRATAAAESGRPGVHVPPFTLGLNKTVTSVLQWCQAAVKLVEAMFVQSTSQHISVGDAMRRAISLRASISYMAHACWHARRALKLRGTARGEWRTPHGYSYGLGRCGGSCSPSHSSIER